MNILTLIFVGIGGALGALCRHKASSFMKRKSASEFPWPTLAINLTSCTIAGCALATSTAMGALAFTVLSMGFLGGFSTLSTMNCEAIDHLTQGRVKTGVAYLFITYLGTLGAAAIGFAAAASIIGL